jgi:hypothetical protein
MTRPLCSVKAKNLLLARFNGRLTAGKPAAYLSVPAEGILDSCIDAANRVLRQIDDELDEFIIPFHRCAFVQEAPTSTGNQSASPWQFHEAGTLLLQDAYESLIWP